MTAVVELTTLAVVIVKMGDDVAPGRMETVEGTTAAGSELVKLTTAPAVGAGPSKFTRLLVLLTPPATLAGDSETELSSGGRTVMVPVLVTPL